MRVFAPGSGSGAGSVSMRARSSVATCKTRPCDLYKGAAFLISSITARGSEYRFETSAGPDLAGFFFFLLLGCSQGLGAFISQLPPAAHGDYLPAVPSAGQCNTAVCRSVNRTLSLGLYYYGARYCGPALSWLGGLPFRVRKGRACDHCQP